MKSVWSAGGVGLGLLLIFEDCLVSRWWPGASPYPKRSFGLQVVLAWGFSLPRFSEPGHPGLVVTAVRPGQVQGVHQGSVCLERHE